ncbi:MAG: hypothetical protein KDA29_05905 [Phycisphaerales bacterium]|nr:hypothetical protein [Phycisphaerales bacterium]
MTRLRRHALIRELLSQAPFTTQETLVAGLADAGISVTQATVSRDLAAIGAVRGANGYRLPDQDFAAIPMGDPIQLRGILRDHVLDVQPAASLVVIHTAPGHANFVASEIDATRPKGMVGCLAGDDTIFIATPSNKAAVALAQQLGTALEVAS